MTTQNLTNLYDEKGSAQLIIFRILQTEINKHKISYTASN
jgi:hypothetical protein